MKLLIIEDERKLSDSIVTYPSAERYICERAFTFDDAMSMLDRYEYDCVLLDLMLPGGDGLDILRAIRSKRNPAGVIIVSAKDSLEGKIKVLEIGADDYLAKPFHLPAWDYDPVRLDCERYRDRCRVDDAFHLRPSLEAVRQDP